MKISKPVFRPILGTDIDTDQVQFPIVASPKLDGIRCIIKDGDMLSRSLKPIRNKVILEKFKNLIEFTAANNIILDGELYNHDLTFQEITSKVMSFDKPADDIELHLFDCIVNFEYRMAFTARTAYLENVKKIFPEINIVPQNMMYTTEALTKYFDELLSSGYEGLILRKPLSPYKTGRSTKKEGFLLKVKDFVTFDAKIIDIIERYENLNESTINELGYKTKSRTVDNKQGTGIAAAFLVEFNGKPLKVVLTGDENFRKDIWINKDNYIGKYIEYKGMLVGSKDLPRHPNFVRFRQDRD